MKWIRPDTITKKSCLQVLMIGLATALFVQLIIPVLFYNMLSPYLSQYVSAMLRANTISQSYIWRGNSMAYALYRSEDLRAELHDYLQAAPESEERQSFASRISSRMNEQIIGNVAHQIPGDGAIISTSYSMLYLDNGDAFYREESAPLTKVLLESDWLSGISADMDMMYSPVLGDDTLQVICFVMPFLVDDVTCYAIHLMDFTYIHQLFKEMENAGIQDYIMFQNDRMLYQNSDFSFEMDTWPDEMFHQLQYETSVLRKQNGMYFATLCSYEGENVKVAAYADRATLLAPYRTLILTIECLLSSIILVLILLIIAMLRHLLKRLTVLGQQIDRVSDGNYKPLPEDTHTDEIGILTRHFNRMVENIEKNMEEKILHEKREQQMQYSLLVSAIDPHFIYNTLNTITFLAYMGKTEEIIEVNTALIGTLKDRLAIKNCKNYDTIATEKEILTQYMVIQSYLCHNTINYRFEVRDEDLELLIPKNVLQPLVENAIIHGILPHKGSNPGQILDGQILVTVSRTSSKLEIIITDNGVGISEADIARYFTSPLSDNPEKDSEHIGICNIRKRLHYLLGDAYCLTAENRKEGGSRMILQLPPDLSVW